MAIFDAWKLGRVNLNIVDMKLLSKSKLQAKYLIPIKSIVSKFFYTRTSVELEICIFPNRNCKGYIVLSLTFD